MTDPVLRWKEDNPGYSGLQWAESRWPFVHEVPGINLMWRVSMYNMTQMRILWEFGSDGIEYANFDKSSEASNDHEIVNIKSDIVEKTWRSTGCASEWVQWDAGAGNTIAIDTFALINTNFSPTAVLTLLAYGTGSDDAPADWGVSGIPIATIAMPTDETEDNVIWCNPGAPPFTAYRHWRLVIEDPSNTDGFVEIGRLIGGEAFVFDSENCTKDIEFGFKNFKNEVNLNGFTSASNNRALKKHLRLTFQDLNVVSQANYGEWNRMVKYCRDTLKMLVIIDPTEPYRFSVFSKLTEIPSEKSRYVDASNLYATIAASWDEGR
jgi:hypothetical protein